jgi:hypothetical protein
MKGSVGAQASRESGCRAPGDIRRRPRVPTHHHATEDVLGDADGRFPVDPEIRDHDLSTVCASFGAISRQPFQPQ